jgi:very-short-patch-repair endonuclease
MEVSVITGGKPHCYKIDVANRTLKIAIEVDGGSHGTLERKAQDARKEEFLVGCGWVVLRFSNKAVTERLAECVQTVLSTISKSRTRTLTRRTV